MEELENATSAAPGNVLEPESETSSARTRERRILGSKTIMIYQAMFAEMDKEGTASGHLLRDPCADAERLSSPTCPENGRLSGQTLRMRLHVISQRRVLVSDFRRQSSKPHRRYVIMFISRRPAIGSRLLDEHSISVAITRPFPIWSSTIGAPASLKKFPFFIAPCRSD